METGENNKKRKKELTAVIILASLILVVAAIFVTQYAIDTAREERGIKNMSDALDKKLSDTSDKAKEVRSEINKELVGTYETKGDPSSDDLSVAIGALTLSPDGNVSMQSYDGTLKKGWWASSKKGETEFVAIGFEGNSAVDMYQVYKSYLIDMKSVYQGKLGKGPRFDTVFALKSDKGQMTIELFGDGKAKGEFIDTNEESENNGLKYLMNGTYSVNSDFIDITLNSATTHFIMFDYGVEGTDSDSGIASVFYEKIQ